MTQFAQAHSHDRLAYAGYPVAERIIAGVCHPQQAIGQRSIYGNNLLNLLHIRLVPRHRHHQAEEVALQIAAAVGLCGQLFRHIGALQGIHPQLDGLLVGFLPVNPHGDTLLFHAVGDVDDVFQRQFRRGLDVQLNVVDPVQDSQIARGKLEFIDRHLIALFCILLHHMHGQGMNDNAVVNLDHQLPLVKEVGRFFHQKRGGEGHKIQ